MSHVESHITGHCDLRASAYSYLGVIGASTQARLINRFPQQTYFARSDAYSSWTESVRPGMSARYLSDLDVASLRMTFSIGATGNVVASGASAAAGIGYSLTFGSTNVRGTQDASVSAHPAPVGEWGTISRTVDVMRVLFPDGTAGFSAFGFTMSSSAYSLVHNSTDDGSFNLAEGNFGSTLVWGGIQQVQAFDSHGNEVTLGDDAGFTLTGEQTGGDYSVSALGVAVTPEPASLSLIAIGLAAFGLVRRRR